jgi:hypothetical protein
MDVDPMAWRLNQSIIRGEIDNRTRDRVTGRIWVLGRELPIEVTLSGNPLRDIAGCLLTFENPNPRPKENISLSPIQMGTTGDMTASRKVRILDVPLEEAIANIERREPIPEHMGNSVYLEWYSRANGRVVIESADYTVSTSPHAWRMTPEEEVIQDQKNQKTAIHWTDKLVESDPEYEDDEDWGMDEFEWEKQLKESDAMTARYSELLETHKEDPNCETIINREMGWEQPEAETQTEHGDPAAPDDITLPWNDALELIDDLPELTPNPQTEGDDWIHGKDGRVRHPLCEKAYLLSMDLWSQCNEKGLLENDSNPELHDMLFQAQALSAKLGGALNSLAYEDDPDGGFVVACLKRSLQYFDEAIRGSGTVAQQDILPEDDLTAFRYGLFQVREEMLRLMTHYRRIQ